MGDLVSLLPQGGAVAGVLVAVAAFLKFQGRMAHMNETVLKQICDSQDRARQGFFEALAEVTRSNERMTVQMAERLTGIEKALDSLTNAVMQMRR